MSSGPSAEKHALMLKLFIKRLMNFGDCKSIFYALGVRLAIYKIYNDSIVHTIHNCAHMATEIFCESRQSPHSTQIVHAWLKCPYWRLFLLRQKSIEDVSWRLKFIISVVIIREQWTEWTLISNQNNFFQVMDIFRWGRVQTAFLSKRG